jgi:hypothetical protein
MSPERFVSGGESAAGKLSVARGALREDNQASRPIRPVALRHNEVQQIVRVPVSQLCDREMFFRGVPGASGWKGRGLQPSDDGVDIAVELSESGRELLPFACVCAI